MDKNIMGAAMEILKLLETTPPEQLYPEDLDFFEAELATGGYPADYCQQCRERIKLLRSWQQPEKPAPQPKKINDSGILMKQQESTQNVPLSQEEIMKRKIMEIREQNDYKSAFKKYVAECAELDEAHLEKYFSFFAPWEVNAIVSVKPLSEEFLEKYFGALDHDKIARYQQFSEGFFMKHYSQLDVDIVLRRGKNPWRKKENRSSQLDVFLRLKGVRI